MTEKPIAYEAYQLLAPHYARLIDIKPHNAYYERPAMVSMWPNLSGKRVFDAGCGPGVYAELLRARGASVISVDISERMLEFARQRLGAEADLRLVDLSQPLTMFEPSSFDFINAPLCMDYIEDWRKLLIEFRRLLMPGGSLQFSCSHPAFDAEYFKTEQYFSVERVEGVWRGFGPTVSMPAYRRSLQEILMPVIEAGFRVDKIVEPLPTDEFRKADPRHFYELSRRPSFLCVQASIPSAS